MRPAVKNNENLLRIKICTCGDVSTTRLSRLTSLHHPLPQSLSGAALWLYVLLRTSHTYNSWAGESLHGTPLSKVTLNIQRQARHTILVGNDNYQVPGIVATWTRLLSHLKVQGRGEHLGVLVLRLAVRLRPFLVVRPQVEVLGGLQLLLTLLLLEPGGGGLQHQQVRHTIEGARVQNTSSLGRI